ncbi:unnamed protein product [Ixodes persulcatus]
MNFGLTPPLPFLQTPGQPPVHGRNGNKRSSGFLRLPARTSSRRRGVQPSCCTVLEWRDNGSTMLWPRRHHLSSSRPQRRKASLRLRVRWKKASLLVGIPRTSSLLR